MIEDNPSNVSAALDQIGSRTHDILRLVDDEVLEDMGNAIHNLLRRAQHVCLPEPEHDPACGFEHTVVLLITRPFLHQTRRSQGLFRGASWRFAGLTSHTQGRGKDLPHALAAHQLSLVCRTHSQAAP